MRWIVLLALTATLMSCNGNRSDSNPAPTSADPKKTATYASRIASFDKAACREINDLISNEKITSCKEKLADLEDASDMVVQSISCQLSAEEAISLMCSGV